MRAMVLDAPKRPLRLVERAEREPDAGEVRLRAEACAVCRTDLHIVDGDLATPRLPIVRGHEIVEAVGDGVQGLQPGQRAGVPWLAHTCGVCTHCRQGRESLCDAALFTGHSRDGGFATHVVAEAATCFPLDSAAGAVRSAPLMRAGLIGWRTLRLAGDDATTMGLFGFGAAAHLIAKLAIAQGRRVHAFTRPQDTATHDFARSLGVAWAGGSDEASPEQLDAALIFAPVGALVPLALRAVRKGGRVICGGIHRSDVPSFPYRILGRAPVALGRQPHAHG